MHQLMVCPTWGHWASMGFGSNIEKISQNTTVPNTRTWGKALTGAFVVYGVECCYCIRPISIKNYMPCDVHQEQHTTACLFTARIDVHCTPAIFFTRKAWS